MTIARYSTVNFFSPDDFFNFDATDENGNMIATITHEPDSYQSWVVFVNDVEVHRTHTCMRAQSYIIWHYNQNTLPAWKAVDNDVVSQETVEEDIEILYDLEAQATKFKSFFGLGIAIVLSANVLISPVLAYSNMANKWCRIDQTPKNDRCIDGSESGGAKDDSEDDAGIQHRGGSRRLAARNPIVGKKRSSTVKRSETVAKPNPEKDKTNDDYNPPNHGAPNTPIVGSGTR